MGIFSILKTLFNIYMIFMFLLCIAMVAAALTWGTPEQIDRIFFWNHIYLFGHKLTDS